MDDPEEAKDKWSAARNFRVQGNNPAISGVAALDQFMGSFLLAASAMARKGIPVSVGTGFLSDTTYYFAIFRMSDRDQQQALAELVPAFVRHTYQHTSALDKQT